MCIIERLYITFGLLLPVNQKNNADVNDKYINILDSRIRYRYQIKGETQKFTYVFLHSFGADLNIWEPIIANLTDGNFISLDLIGFGLSDQPKIIYNLKNQSNYLMAFIETLELKNIILIGSSMGSSLALYSASRNSSEIKCLILFAPSAYPGTMKHKWPGNLFYKKGFLNMIGITIVKGKLFRILFPNSLGLQALQITASYDSTFIEVLSDIKQPTLLIWSLGDKRVPYSNSSIYLNIIKESKLITKPLLAGHSAYRFQPELTAFEMQKFIFENIQ
jgi:pimeloyl-ACP methyl ester carboxylesterase